MLQYYNINNLFILSLVIILLQYYNINKYYVSMICTNK